MVKFPLTVLGTLKTVLYPYLYNPANLPLALTAPDCPTAPELSWGDELDPKDHKELGQKLMDIVSDEEMVMKIVNTIALKDSPRPSHNGKNRSQSTCVENRSRRLY